MLWETIAEGTCTMDCTSFQMSPPNPTSKYGAARRALQCASEMTMDDLSFYNDETVLQQQQPRTPSPELLGLLSPEGSPQRFHIITQQQLQQQQQQQQQHQHQQHTTHGQFLQPMVRQQKLNTTVSTNTSSNMPVRSLRNFNSLSSTSSMESSIDDEYMELFAMESYEAHTTNGSMFNFPSNLNSLISGQIKNSSPRAGAVKTPEMRCPLVRRCLSMTENIQPKTPETAQVTTSPFATTSTSNCFKRPEPPAANVYSPVQSKRHRLADKENCLAITNTENSPTPAHPPILRKCMSMNDAEIMAALTRSENKDEPDLIGDFSKAYALPLMEGRHRDLKSISSATVARLLRGDFDDTVSNFKIIDCRYPYEFEGGHIKGAKNLYTQEQLMEEFLNDQQSQMQSQKNTANGSKRNIIIFHCEFSSERGPKMSRFLRNIDRARNTNVYPALDYPEMYLLHNGYKEFFENHSELCQPVAYRTMLEPGYNEAYRHFRAKSKSWNGDGLGGATGRLKKSRSRLLL